MNMSLYKIWQTVNDDCDTFDSAVVAAESSEEARKIQPGEFSKPFIPHAEAREERAYKMDQGNWCLAIEDVHVQYLGGAAQGTRPGIIVASYNAG